MKVKKMLATIIIICVGINISLYYCINLHSEENEKQKLEQKISQLEKDNRQLVKENEQLKKKVRELTKLVEEQGKILIALAKTKRYTDKLWKVFVAEINVLNEKVDKKVKELEPEE